MKRASEVARRYAKAFFDEVHAGKADAKVILAEIRTIRDAIEKDPEVKAFFDSPIVTAAIKEDVLKKTFGKQKVSPAVTEFISFLAKRNRLKIFADSVEVFESLVDLENGVVRGTVQSAEALDPKERAEIEKVINKSTNKKVILNYHEDASIMGGLIAQVGSLTFDDTLSSHLKRLKEDLKKRSVH